MQNQPLGWKATELFRALATERRLIWLLVFLSAAIRTLYLFQVRDNPFLSHPRLDALFHDTWALSIAHGNVTGDHVFFRAPLYAYLLGFVYWIFGQDYFIVRVFQHLLGVVSVVLVYVLGKKLFDERTSFLAAFLTAVNPMLIYFEGQLLFESFLGTLILVWLLVLYNAYEKQKWTTWFFAGVVLGLLGITRPPVLAVGLCVVAIVAWEKTRDSRLRHPSISFFALALGLTLIILPVTIRNYIVGNEFVLIASQGGVNFFIGNNPDADGFSSSMPKRLGANWENRNETYYVQKQIGHKPTAAEESAFWYKQAFQFIAQEPDAFLKLLLKKFYLFWNHREIPNNLNFDFFRRYSPLLHHNPFGFWLFGPFALLGIFVAAFAPGQARQYGILLWFVALYVVLTILFFVCDRYRAPIIPLLAMFASYGIFCLIDSFRRREYKKFIFSVVAALVFVLVVNSNFYPMFATSNAREYFTLGIIAHDKNRTDEALENFGKAYEQNPFFPNVGYNLGVSEWLRGNTKAAMKWFYRELELDSGSFNSNINLAQIYYGYRQTDSVEHFARKAIGSKPYLPLGYIWFAKANLVRGQIAQAESILIRGSALCDESDFVYGEYLLGGIYAAQGRLPDAEARYRSALSRLSKEGGMRQPLYEPEFAYSNEQKIGEEVNVLQAKSYYGLGHVFVSRRNLDSAAISFARATTLDPQYADAFVDLGVTLLHLKRFNEAESAASRAVQLNPNHYLYWFNYGDVLAVQKKYDEARRAFQKSLSLRPDFLLAKERLDQIRQMF